MLTRSWRMGSVFGFELRIDLSWLLIALVIAWSFYLRYDVDHVPGAVAGERRNADRVRTRRI